MRKTLLPLFCAGLLAIPSAQAEVVADAANDYQSAPDIAADAAPTAPPTGWEYIYSDAVTGGIEVALTPGSTVGDSGNMGFGSDQGGGGETPVVLGSITAPDNNFAIFGNFGHAGVVGTDLLLHPGNTDPTAYVIARYTISAADIANGTFATISGSFRDQQGSTTNTNAGPSIQAFVLVNGATSFAVTGAAGRVNNDGTSPNGIFNVETTVVQGDVISFVVFNNGLFFGDETALQASIDLGDAPVDESPTITSNPDNQDLFIGDTLNLVVAASGSPTLTYQWRKDMVAIVGETNPTFSIASVVEDDAASYDCVVTNDSGSATSMASLVTVSVEAPTIVTPPESQDLFVGQTLNLSVVADGSPTLTYQWAKAPVGGDETTFVNIAGATSPTFTIASVTLDDTGDYDCSVTNDAGSVFTTRATIIVRDNNAPVATAPDGNTLEDTPLIFSVGDLATDADGDLLQISGTSGTSANGATISNSPTEVGYFPTAGLTTDDTFTVEVTDGFETVSVTVTVDVLAISAGKITIADAALDYVAAAGGLVEDLAANPSGWGYFGSEAASGANLNALTAGRVGNQNPADDYQGFVGVSDFGTAAVYGTNTAESVEFELFANGEGNMGIVGTDLLLHPGQAIVEDDLDEEDPFVILRYTVSANDVNGQVPGTGTISGSFRELVIGGNGAVDSISSEIFLNGVSQFAALGNQSTPNALTQAEGTFDITGLTFEVGDTIDFVVGINGRFGADETALQAAICVDFDPALFVAPAGEVVIDSCDFVGTGFQVVASGLTSGTDYQLRRSANLSDGFPTVVGDSVTGTGSGDVFTDPNPLTGAGAKSFYAIFETP